MCTVLQNTPHFYSLQQLLGALAAALAKQRRFFAV
jgi:hypothetical protein